MSAAPVAASRAILGPLLALLAMATGCFPNCSDPAFGPFVCDPRTRDSQDKLESLATYLTLERGDATTSGAPVLGQGNTLGGGRLALSLRATPMGRGYPDIRTTAVRTDGMTSGGEIPAQQSSSVAIAADGSLGVWGGLNRSGPRVLGVDALFGVTALPGYRQADLGVAGATQISPAFGARVDILAESRGNPAVSLVWRTRYVPSISLSGPSVPSPDGGVVALEIDDLDIWATALRFTVAKQFGRTGVTVGIGQDTYRASGHRIARLQFPDETVVGSTSSTFSLGRRHTFVGLSHRFGGLNVGGELGRLGQSDRDQFGGSTRIGGEIGRARGYLSFGVRLGG